jgi:hypothetical protein
LIEDIKNNVVFIKEKNYLNSSITPTDGSVFIREVLPFRIRLTDIKIPGYGPNNIPGIGLQIIGYSNYIL